MHRKRMSSTYRRLPMDQATLPQSAEKPSEIALGAARSVDHFALARHFGKSIPLILGMRGNYKGRCAL
jgi:hypothetical protein